MGHNSKIGYPYLPAREPWRGQDVWRGRRTTLAGTHSLKQLGGRPWRGWRTTLAGTALWHSQQELGGRPWRGRRTTWRGQRFGTRKKSLVGDPGGDGALALATRAWRATRAGTADDLEGTALWHSQKELGGRPWLLAGEPGRDGGRPWRGRRFDNHKKSLAGEPGGDGGRPWRGQHFGTRKKSLAGDPGGDGGRPWRGRRFGTRKKSLAGDPGGNGALALAKRA